MPESPGFTIGPEEDSPGGFTIGPEEDIPTGFTIGEGENASDTYILNLVGDPFYIPTYEEYLAYDKARNRESVPFIKTVGEAAEMAWNDITGFFTGLVNLGAEGEVGQMAAALGEGAARGTADLGQLVRKGIYDNIQYAIGDDADDYKTFLATRELDAMRERARRGDESLMFELIPEANRVAEGFSYVADPSVFVPGLGIGSKAVTKGASAATRGAGKAIAGTGRLLQRPADAIASRVGDLASTAEAATMRRPGLGMSTVQTAGGIGRGLETMGELFKEAGKQMEKAPSRVGLLRSIEYSADAAENIRKLAGRGARVLDPGLSAIGKLGEGVITGATVGGVLGGIAEGERGLYSGMGAGGLLGGTASTIAGVGGKVTGLANRSKRRNDYNNWLKQFDPESRKRIEHYVGDNLNNAAEVMGIDDLGVGIMGKDTVIEYLTEAEARAAKAEWHERETGEKIDPDAIPDFRGVEFLDSTTEGQIPRILINVEHKVKPGHTLAHEVFHSLNKMDGMQDYISRLNAAILGTEMLDGTPLKKGLLNPDQFADLADQYATKLLKEAPRRGKKAKKGVTVKDKKGKYTKESVDVYNKFKNNKTRVLEEIGAEYFAALLSGKPDYLVPGRGMDSLTRQAMDSLLLADSSSRIGRMQKILDASFGKIFKWDKITGESELFSINGKPITGNPMLNALMRDMIRAKRAIRDRMEVAPGKRREVEIKPLNTPQEGLKKFINRHKDHPITNLFETDKKGKVKPKKIADTHQEEVELSNKIADAIESVADDGDPKTMRTSTDEKGNSIFKGARFSPKQMEAIKNTPGINNKVLEYLEMLNELIGEGRQIDLEYYAATRLDRQGRRRYSSGIKQSRRLVVPYSIEVSRAGNFLVRALDASKLGDKIDGWKKSRKEWIRNWTNMDELYSDLARYLQNLASPAPEPSAKLFGEKKRNILNELMGARGRAGFNPLALEKMAEKDFLVRSFRVDRVTEMNLDAGLPGLKGEKIPYGEQSYALQKENYMPETDDVPSRISTRYPTGVNRMEDPLSAVLLINSESIFKLPQDKQEIVAETISKYVNLKIPKAKQKDLKYVSEQLKQQSVDNLLWLFDQVPEEVRKRSKLWYDGARKLSEEWSGKYKVSTATVAGVLASLSPQKDWFMNVSLAERVLDIYKNKAKGPMTPEMIQKARSMTDLKGDLPKVIIEQLDKMAGKNFKQLTTLQKAIYTRIYDEVHNSRSYGVFSPEGKNLGMKTKKDGEESKVAWGSYKQIENAVRAIEDPSYESLSALTGDQHKVRNFYNNILLPNKALEDVTIDTHAVAAALLRPLAGSDTEVTHNLGGGVPASSITGAKGTYGFFADAYREAARQRGMKPREMQSITWEAVRGLFPAEWKQNKKNKVLVDSLWKRYSGGRTKIDVIRKEILKSAGGINNPEWFGFDSRGAKGGGSRGDTKKLAGPGVSRGAAKTGGYGGRGYPGDPRVPTTGKIPVFLEEKTQPKEIRFAFMPATATDAVAKQVGERPKLGVNINSGKIPFGDMIIKGLKTIETRRDLSRNGLRRPSKTGETIALVSTFGGGKQAEIIGTAKVGEPVEYNTLKEFRADYKKHRVDPGSEYDWDGYKVGYPLKEVKPLSKPVPVPKGTPGSPMHKNLDGVNYMPADQAFSKAKEAFGTTKDPLEAGYVLPGGEMLDFSGRHEGSPERDIKGKRYSDHREISQIGTEMDPFIDLGAARIDAISGLIDLGKDPTASQSKIIRRVIEDNNSEVHIDLKDGNRIEQIEPETGTDPKRVIGLIKRFYRGDDISGAAGNFMPAGRAKAGGEVGLNRDFYKGGQFLPSTEMPKRDRAKIEKQASGKEHFERGYGKENWAIPEPYKAPLLRWYSTFMNDAHMDYLTREGTPMEYIKTMEDFRKRFESGERWIDIREYPDFADPKDLARLFKAGLPIPEASFDKLDHSPVVKSMRKHSKKATGDEANLMPATEADSRIPSRVPPKLVVSNRSPMLQWLAQSFIEKGLIDKEDWDTAVNALSPIDAQRSQIPDAYKVGQVNQNYPMVLDSVKQEKFVDVLLGEGPKEGTSVGLRIDIKAFENSLAKVASGELDFPVYVVAIHSEGSAKSIGKDIEGYSAIAAVSNPSFLIGSEKGSLAIAAGKPKTTLATVEGEWMPLSEVPNVTGEGWTRVGMDPTRHSYFYDKASGQPIKGGSLAISFGNTVFVRDAIPMTPEEASRVLYMPAKEVGGSTVYKGEEGARVIKTKSGKYRVYGANKALLGIASSQKMADRILQRGTKKVSIRKRPSRGLAGVGGS